MARAESTPTLPPNGSALIFTVGKQQTFRFQETYPKAVVIDASLKTAVLSIDSRLELFNNNTQSVQGIRLLEMTPLAASNF